MNGALCNDPTILNGTWQWFVTILVVLFLVCAVASLFSRGEGHDANLGTPINLVFVVFFGAALICAWQGYGDVARCYGW